MYEYELEKYEWKISKDLKKFPFDAAGVSLEEQEASFLIRPVGDKGETNPKILVDASDQTVITQLSKSQYFTLERVDWSTHPKTTGRIIFIRGTLEPQGLTIRKVIPKFSEEQRKMRSDRMKLIGKTNKRL